MHDDALPIDFISLKENQDWLAIYRLYQTNSETFSTLINKLMSDYHMTKVQARDTVLYELMSAHYGRQHRKLLYSPNRLQWSAIYLITFVGICFSGVLSLFIAKKNQKINLLYEEMFAHDGWSKRFYKYIDEVIPKERLTKAVFYTHPGLSRDFSTRSVDGWSGDVINRRYSSMFLNFKEVCLSVYHDLFYCVKLFTLSKNINTTYLYLRILRKYLLYSSQIKNIKADVLVSAGDYYWNPIKYFIYKKNIANIILLQHNFKNEYLHNRLFQYCDFYYAHSHQAIEKLEGIPFAQKYAIGSFQLIPYLKEEPIEYDILFLNQTVNDDLKNLWPNLDQERLISDYYRLIDNFKRYMENNKNLKAIYVAKGETINANPSLNVKHLFHDLPNVEFKGTYGPQTFETVQKSKLLINMYSSVGFEAYGLGKKVLWINYEKCCDIFKYDTEHEELHVMIDDTGYDAFEKRVNLLLSDTKEVNEHYAKLKEKYMNIQENPASVVADKIVELVGNI